MLHRNNPRFLHEIQQSLYTAVLSDVLDELGFRDQAMAPSIRPLDEDLTLAGFARTGLYREVFTPAPARTVRTRMRWSTTSSPMKSPCSDVAARAASRRGASCYRPRPGRVAQPAA
jgi:hypothetical protein